ncbi:MAG: ISL3 family transposase [Oscillospiraceae bacterium]|nr:ISL3 family transposase [Oscillospiraceae bacterium]
MNIEQLDESQKALCSALRLEAEDIESITARKADDLMMYDVKLTPKFDPCPCCGSTSVPPKINKYVAKRITHSVLTGMRCVLVYHARRYKCEVCGKTYYEPNPLVFKKQKISVQTVSNVLDDLKDPAVTFTATAARNNISPTTAASIFDTHVNIPRQRLPGILEIDEVYAFKHKELKSKYVCVMYDFTNKTPVDLLPSRTKKCLSAFFEAIPLEERETVQVVCTDMWDDYRWASKKYLKQSIHAVDRFHISKNINEAADAVRRRLMSKCPRKSADGFGRNPDYYLYKSWNWVLWRRDSDVDSDGKPLFATDRTGSYNSILKGIFNYYQIREKLLDLSPELREAWKLKESLITFYEGNTKKEAEEKFPALVQTFRKSSVEEMRKFGKTLAEWRIEILNSFDIQDVSYGIDPATGEISAHGIRPTTAALERRNGILKLLRKSACGYTSWPRFRNRGMYVLMPDTEYRISPLEAARRADQEKRKEYMAAAEKRQKEIEQYNQTLEKNTSLKAEKKSDRKRKQAAGKEAIPETNAISYSAGKKGGNQNV